MTIPATAPLDRELDRGLDEELDEEEVHEILIDSALISATSLLDRHSLLRANSPGAVVGVLIEHQLQPLGHSLSLVFTVPAEFRHELPIIMAGETVGVIEVGMEGEAGVGVVGD